MPLTLESEALGVATRLSKGAAPLFTANYYGQIIRRTAPFFYACLNVICVHVITLWKVGALSQADARMILEALKDITLDDVDARLGNIYLNVEKTLMRKVPEGIAGNAYTGISRADYEATTRRIYTRDQVLKILKAVLALRETVLNLALQHLETIMPGYTHSQHGQPWTFAHYLIAFADGLQRDFERLLMAFRHANQSPLGTGALAGVNLPLDRRFEASLMGFDGLVVNAKDAVCSRDYALETAAACATLMSNLGQVATEVVCWCTTEFGMVELDDGFSGTSSYMPQKKNPLAMEEIRAMAGHSIGWVPSLLGVLKTCSEEVDEAEFCPDTVMQDCTETTSGMVELMNGALATMKVNVELMSERARRSWATASELAFLIHAREGIPWRVSHGIVGRLIRMAKAAGRLPGDPLKELSDQAARELVDRPLSLSESEIQGALDPVRFIHTRETIGSVNPRHTREQIAESRQSLFSDTQAYSRLVNAVIAGKEMSNQQIQIING